MLATIWDLTDFNDHLNYWYMAIYVSILSKFTINLPTIFSILILITLIATSKFQILYCQLVGFPTNLHFEKKAMIATLKYCSCHVSAM